MATKRKNRKARGETMANPPAVIERDEPPPPAVKKLMKYTPELASRICNAYIGLNGNKALAAKACGVSIRTLEHWLNERDDFRLMFEDAENLLIDTVESALIQSAREKTVPSMIFFLKNRRPDRWRDTATLSIENAEAIADEVRKLVDER